MLKPSHFLTEDERRVLEDLCTSNDDGLILRAKIILGFFAALKSIQVIASENKVTEKTVYKWVHRYQKYGIVGIRAVNPGQSQLEKAKTDLLTKRIQELNNGGISSVKDMAATLGVSTSAVYRSLDRAGISTTVNRHTRWSYATIDHQAGNSPYLAGIYLSRTVKFVVLCETSEQLKGMTIHGVFYTRDKNLYKEVEQSAATLRMVDTVVAARNHISFKHAESEGMANRFLTETIDDWPEKDNYRFHVIGMGTVHYMGTRMKGIHYSWAENVESWMNLILQPFYGIAHVEEYGIVTKDLKVLRSYVDALRPDSDPYMWRMVYGDYSPLTTVLTSSEESGSIGDSLESVEDAIKTLFPGGLSVEQPSGGTRVGSVIVMQDGDGQLTYRTVTADALFPEINEEIGTPEGFDHMINDLDRKMTALSHEVNLAGRDMYLTNLKKNNMP